MSSDAASDRRLATTIAMLLATISVTVGDLLMSQAMRELGPLKLVSVEGWMAGKVAASFALRALPGEVNALLWTIFGSARVWMAIGCMLIFLVLWMISLSWSDLTFVMPLTALTYVLNAILVGPVLGEQVSSTRWVGTILIAVGVALVTLEKSEDKS
jgi:drug/metabolite transporter (DMT)-like permease